MEYTFTLKYQLADDDRDPDALVERLGEVGCDDALVGIGQPGRLALEFTREAADADEAVRSALADVRRAVPSARLISDGAGLGWSDRCGGDCWRIAAEHAQVDAGLSRQLPRSGA